MRRSVWLLKRTLIVFGLLNLCCVHQRFGEVEYKLTENHKEALLYHDGEAANLILRTRLSAGTAQGPAELAWIIPLPSLPASYQEAPEHLFRDLYELLPDREVIGTYSIPLTCSATAPEGNYRSPIRVHAVEQVGSYQIQAVEITADDAAGALNHWLRSNGFGEVSREQQSFYLETGRCFLCVKVAGLDRSGDSMQLPGLHIRYPGNELTLPLKFSTHSGTFDVDLYYLSSAINSPPSRDIGNLDQLGFTPKGHVALPKQLPKSLKPLKKHGELLYRFSAKQGNRPARPLSDWPNDPAISVQIR